LEGLAFGLAGLAFVLAAAFVSFKGGFVLGAALAGDATGADSLAAGLLAGTGTVFWGSTTLAGPAGVEGRIGGEVTAGEGFLGGAGVAALAGGCATG
jgi:hypothetical protein